MKKTNMNLILTMAFVAALHGSGALAFSVSATRTPSNIKIKVTGPIQENCIRGFNFDSIQRERLGTYHYALHLRSNYQAPKRRTLCLTPSSHASLTLIMNELLPEAFFQDEPTPGERQAVQVDVIIDGQASGSFSYDQTAVLPTSSQ